MRTNRLLTACTLAFTLAAAAGCAHAPGSPALVGSAPAASPATPTTVTAVAGTGARQIAVTFSGASGEVTRHVQAVGNRAFTANDVYEYDLTLQVQGQDGTWSDVLSPVVCPQKTPVPAGRARFTGLSQGNLYRVSVVAKGNFGGTAADLVLNSKPAYALYDFTAVQDVEDTLTGDVTVTFDPVVPNFSFVGTADKVSPFDATRPDGRLDAHYDAKLTLPAGSTITQVHVYGVTADGTQNGLVWDSNSTTGCAKIGVYSNGTLVNTPGSAALRGTYGQTFDLDLYTAGDGNAIDGGNWLVPGGLYEATFDYSYTDGAGKAQTGTFTTVPAAYRAPRLID